jgi:hypothetical protein
LDDQQPKRLAANIRTSSGLAYGTESGTMRYGDSTDIAKRTWGPNQTLQATVHTINQNDDILEGVELRLRSSLSADKATGYEVNFTLLQNAKSLYPDRREGRV